MNIARVFGTHEIKQKSFYFIAVTQFECVSSNNRYKLKRPNFSVFHRFTEESSNSFIGIYFGLFSFNRIEKPIHLSDFEMLIWWLLRTPKWVLCVTPWRNWTQSFRSEIFQTNCYFTHGKHFERNAVAASLYVSVRIISQISPTSHIQFRRVRMRSLEMKRWATHLWIVSDHNLSLSKYH